MVKHYLSANDYQRDIWRLAAAIRKSGWQPDFLVGLWRGGAPVAIAVHEFFKATGWDVKHIPLKCASYTGIGQNDGKVIFTHGEMIFGMFRKGDKVLFIDDVFDTGKTASAVREEVKKIGAEMRLACVYWKPEKNKSDMKPDYYTKDIGNDWLVFPHEIEGLTSGEIAVKDPVLFDLMKV